MKNNLLNTKMIQKTWQTINEILNINRTSKDLPDKRIQKTVLRIPRKLQTNLTNIL